jgi:hypothetical protein
VQNAPGSVDSREGAAVNGPEHYREAEKHLRHSAESSIDDGTARWHQQQAQVHATLAQVAATIETTNRRTGEWQPWIDAGVIAP